MRLSIIHKFVIGFLIIFCIGYIVITFFMNSMIVENNKMIIKKNLLPFQKDLSLYLKQYFKLKEDELNSNNFEANAKNIALELAFKADNRIIVYSNKGEFLADSANANGQVLYYEDMSYNKENIENKDLTFAINNKSAFEIIPFQDKHLVAFSCPIINNGKNIGIIRSIKDYSEVFSESKNLLKVVNICILIVFGSIFLFIVLLARKLTIPIVKLSKATKEVAKGHFDTSIEIDSKDEIGNLAQDFKTMKKQIENQIEIIKSDRDNLQKLEGYKKEFFDNLTHEMKTPLTIISGYSQIMIKDDFEDYDFMKKCIRKIKGEADSLHNMILKLLEISMMESDIKSQAVEVINFSRLVNTACNDMKIKANKYGTMIEKDIEENILIQGNQDELRSVIINLIDNSIKYGSIKSQVKIKLYQEDTNCTLIVEDKGKGISQDKREKIFEPFYRVDKENSRKEGSYGLGLAIVKNAIDKHNGKIDIFSKENVGTKIYVKIPLKPDYSKKV